MFTALCMGFTEWISVNSTVCISILLLCRRIVRQKFTLLCRSGSFCQDKSGIYVLFWCARIMGRVESRLPCPPSSNRAYGFPVHDFPMFFITGHAPSSIQLLLATWKDHVARTICGLENEYRLQPGCVVKGLSWHGPTALRKGVGGNII